jgi:cytoskeletal protein RodZ
MSENTEADPHAKAEPIADRVGDILRKERITRRIALETIAKDLKLNVKYIKSLEANDYSGLPADPYIRVYFRSIAKYLLLDPEEILKRFYEERGGPAEAYKDRDSKLTISLVENKRSFKPWTIIVSAIVVLAIFSFIVNKSGGASSGTTEQTGEKASGKKHTDSDGKNPSGVSGDSAEDSLIGALIPHNETAAPAATPAVASVAPVAASAAASGALPVEKKETAVIVDPGKSLTLEIRALKDSVWVQIFSDGQSWKRYMYSNQSKRFTARDSFNVHVGNNSILRYTYNGKSLTVHANDVAVFKLSRSGPNPEMWNLGKWASVFKNRT